MSYEMGDEVEIEFTEDDCSVEFEQGRKSFHVNEFGERIPYALTVAPVESECVTDKILQAMQVLR